MRGISTTWCVIVVARDSVYPSLLMLSCFVADAELLPQVWWQMCRHLMTHWNLILSQTMKPKLLSSLHNTRPENTDFRMAWLLRRD